MTSYRLEEIARAIGAALEGAGDVEVCGMAALEDAGADRLSYAQSPDRRELVRSCRAAGVIVGPDFPAMQRPALLRVADAKVGFVRAMEMFAPDRRQVGVHPSAVIAAGAEIGEGVSIGPCVVVGAGARVGSGSQLRAGAHIGANAQIGSQCDIGVNAVVLEDVRIGDRCVLQPGAVVGADGYGFHWLDDHHHKIPQLGTVVVEDDVEIGANACIDRATLGETRIGHGSKFDNLVQVGHNNRIGAHVLLVSQVGIAGSCTLGTGVVAAGQVGIADHLTIGDGAQIGAQAGVARDVEPGARVWGSPARPMARVLREQAALQRLPDLLKTVREQAAMLQALGERLQALEDRNAGPAE